MTTYSIFNNYEYNNKIFSCKILDFFSFPIRTFCGGKDINLIIHAEGDLPSTSKKITMLMLSLIIFPVGLIGIICISMKVLIEDKKKIITFFLSKILPSKDQENKTQEKKTPPDNNANAFAEENTRSPNNNLTYQNFTIDNVVEKIKNNPNALEYFGRGRHRFVHRIMDTDYVIKSQVHYTLTNTQTDCLAYEISEKLRFEVVPHTQYLPIDSKESMEIASLYPTLKQPFILQKFIDEKKNTEIEVNQAHKVIFFNLITGRSDKKRANSVIDIHGKIWEIDNEGACAEEQKHWLLDDKKINVPISNELLKWILDLPDSIELNKSSLPKAFRIEQVVYKEKTISSKLANLKNVIRKLQNEKITITFSQIEEAFSKIS